MNILIIGSGGREHAFAAAFSRSPQSPALFCCGNSLNPGILSLTKAYWLGDVTNVQAVIEAIKAWAIDLAIIGPESPLERGLADALWELNIPTVGPKKLLAQIESSKIFARELMEKYCIPGLPLYQKFSSLKGVNTFLEKLGNGHYVIKADGLTGGKGVKVAGEHLHSYAEAYLFCDEIHSLEKSFIIEEKLIGQEFSFMCFCDGKRIVPMPIVKDHKRAYVNDEGPNTGGMGSYTAANHGLPFLTEEEISQAAMINHAIIDALHQEINDIYLGILYGSFIATAKGVYVIEFNARFGDPEALNVLAILETDFVAICQALVKGELSHSHVSFKQCATVCKYLVPNGYPNDSLKNQPIDVTLIKDKSQLYFASVNVKEDSIVTLGSRAAAYVGIADSITAAEKIAEEEITQIAGPFFHRHDIGTESSIEKRILEMRQIRT